MKKVNFLLIVTISLIIIVGLLMLLFDYDVNVGDWLCNLWIIEGTEYCKEKKTIEACKFLCLPYPSIELKRCIDICRGEPKENLDKKEIVEEDKDVIKIDKENVCREVECAYGCYTCTCSENLRLEEIKSKRELKGVTILDEIEFDWDIEPYESYKIGTAEFRRYPMTHTEESVKLGYFEAYNNGKIIYDSRDGDSGVARMLSLLSFKYKTNTYIFLDSWGGGAHSSYSIFAFVLDKNNNLKFIDTLGTMNFRINKSDLMTKDDKLYLATYDDRFFYFYACYYSKAYFYYRFLLLDGDKIINKASDFKDDYLLEAQRCENKLSAIQKGIESNNEDIINQYNSLVTWSPLLVCKIVNYELAGEKEKAWSNFDDYLSTLPLEHHFNNEEHCWEDKVDVDDFKSELISIFEFEDPFKE